jgi:hypothetical protein
MASNESASLKTDEKVCFYLKETLPATRDVGSQHFLVYGHEQRKFMQTRIETIN